METVTVAHLQGYNDEESSEQGVESFKVYENSSFSPTT